MVSYNLLEIRGADVFNRNTLTEHGKVAQGRPAGADRRTENGTIKIIQIIVIGTKIVVLLCGSTTGSKIVSSLICSMRNSAVDKSVPAPLALVKALLAATKDAIAKPTRSIASNTSINVKPFFIADWRF
jgi:hypothetical protein